MCLVILFIAGIAVYCGIVLMLVRSTDWREHYQLVKERSINKDTSSVVSGKNKLVEYLIPVENKWVVPKKLEIKDAIKRKEETKRPTVYNYSALCYASNEYKTCSFPIAIVAYNRVEMLKRTIVSLLEVDGIEKSQITVYQDGLHEGVANLVNGFGISLNQRNEPARIKEQESGSGRINVHYKYVLQKVFQDNSDAKYAIIVEDDMLFAKDFLHFFAQTAILYELDPSVYCISSFNENGFRGRVKDNSNLKRSDFFIGLGWLVSKRMLFDDWIPKWAEDHWDHNLRKDEVRRGRQCIYPEISRNYNIGSEGTHIDNEFFMRYFYKIVLPSEKFVPLDIARVTKENYGEILRAKFASSIPVSSWNELRRLSGKNVTIFYDSQKDSTSTDAVWRDRIAPFFGVWHEHIRNSFDDTHEFWHGSNYLIFIPKYSNFYKLKPEGSSDFDTSGFSAEDNGEFTFTAGKLTESCHDTCKSLNQTCDVASIKLLNTCSKLKEHFPCSSCEMSEGKDQPAYDPRYKACLIHKGQDHTCSGKHEQTQRLCSCSKGNSKHSIYL
jgi:hypothetical protein